MAKKTLLDNIIESIKDVDGRLIKQSGTTKQMISDLNYKVVAPAKSAADSAQSAADAAVASAQVTSDAVSAIASATAEAKQGANDAMSRAMSAWDAARSNVNLIDSNYASASASISSARTEAIAAADEAKSSASAAQADIVVVKSSVAVVQADVAATRSDVAVAKSDIADTKANLSSQANSLSSYAAQASANGADIVTLKSQAGQLEQDMADTKGDVSQLKVSASATSVALSDAAGNISNLQATAKSFSAALSDTNSNVASVTATASELETKYADAAGDISTLQANAKGMTQTISDAQGDIAQLKTRADGFDTEFATANGNISKLQTDATGTTQTLANTKSDVAVLQSRADGLDAKYADAAGDINTLKTNASGFSQTLTNAQGDISTLKSTVSGVQTTLTDAQGNISTLQSDVSGLKKTTSDNAGNIATLQATANTLTSQMSSAQGDISTLKQTSSDFSSKVSGMETSLSDANSKITANTTAIEQNKQAIALKADQTTVDNLSGEVSQNTAQLKVQADQIASKVSSSDLDAKGYATQTYVQSFVTQTAGTINESIVKLGQTVKQGAENNVQLVRKSDFEDGDKGGWDAQTVVATDPPAELGQSGMKVLQTNVRDDYEEGIWYSVKPGENFDVDFWCEPSTACSSQLGLLFTDKDYNNYNNWAWAGISTDQSGQWKHYTGTITAPPNVSFAKPWFYMGKDGSNTTDTALLAKPSIRRQNATTVAAIQQITASIDGLQSNVTNLKNDTSSQINQLSNLIATKVSQDDYNSQITQLNNDINLRVKSADLISQINLQAGTALIQSNKLVLDAGTTVFTGEAFIPSAAISSISADKIMLGSSALWNTDGTLNLVNQSNNLKALIQVKQGLVQNTTQSIISFASDYNTRAFSITPVGATVTPTLFFERYDQTPDHWLGFSRNEVQREGLTFNTWDNEGERFFVDCHARFHKNLSTEGIIYQGSWNNTTGKPLAGILSIESGNTIWSGSGYLAVGDHVSNSYTNVIAKSFSQQSTLSSKTNIEEVDPKDALDLVNQTDIRSYQYKSDVEQGKTKRYTSLIIDDVNDVSQYYAPDEFTNEERTGRDDGSAVGYLFLAIQELTRRIKTLEEKLNG